MKIFFITPFPDTINIFIKNNIANQGIKKGLIDIQTIDLRKFSRNSYKKIDDEPYGGGDGMVMMCQPLFDAIEFCIRMRFQTYSSLPFTKRKSFKPFIILKFIQ